MTKITNPEHIAKVAYIFGVIQSDLNDEANSFDWEDIVVECEKVASDWKNMIDIQNFEEEGYVMKYAERIFFEKFGKQQYNE